MHSKNMLLSCCTALALMAIFSSSVVFAELRRETDQVAFRGGGGERGGGGRNYGGEHQNYQNRGNWNRDYHNQNWDHHNWNGGYYGGYYEGGVEINPIVPEVNPYYEGETPDQIYQNEIYQQNTPG